MISLETLGWWKNDRAVAEWYLQLEVKNDISSPIIIEK